jgi:hypothetical protein
MHVHVHTHACPHPASRCQTATCGMLVQSKPDLHDVAERNATRADAVIISLMDEGVEVSLVTKSLYTLDCNGDVTVSHSEVRRLARHLISLHENTDHDEVMRCCTSTSQIPAAPNLGWGGVSCVRSPRGVANLLLRRSFVGFHSFFVSVLARCQPVHTAVHRGLSGRAILVESCCA